MMRERKQNPSTTVTSDTAPSKFLRLNHGKEIHCISCDFATWGQHFWTVSPWISPFLSSSPVAVQRADPEKNVSRRGWAGAVLDVLGSRSAPWVSVSPGWVLGCVLLPWGPAADWIRLGLPGYFGALFLM